MDDRVMQRWTRDVTPPPNQKLAVKVLSIVFPTPHLSTALEATKKNIRWISPAVGQNSKLIQLIFTRDSESDVEQILAADGGELVAFHPLSNGEAFAVTAQITPWEEKTIIVPGKDGETEDLVLPNFATPTIERPISFTTFIQPEEMRCFEFTGFKMPSGKAKILFPDAIFISREKIVAAHGSLFANANKSKRAPEAP